jgi:hypothetical protein
MDTYTKRVQQRIDDALLWLLYRAPFWSTLLRFVEIEIFPYPKLPRLDGKTISFTGSESYWESPLSAQQTASRLAFSAGQAMLLHPALRGLSCPSGQDVALEISLSKLLSLAPLYAPTNETHDLSLSGLPPAQIYHVLYNQEMPDVESPVDLVLYWRSALFHAARAYYNSREFQTVKSFSDDPLLRALERMGLSFEPLSLARKSSHLSHIWQSFEPISLWLKWKASPSVLLICDDIWHGIRVGALPCDKILLYEVAYTLGEYCPSLDAAIFSLQWVFLNEPSLASVMGQRLLPNMRKKGLQGKLALMVQKNPYLHKALREYSRKFTTKGGVR